jgi:hypothetical protein
MQKEELPNIVMADAFMSIFGFKRVKPTNEELEGLYMEKKYDCEYCNGVRNQELVHNKLDELAIMLKELKILLEVNDYTIFDLSKEVYRLLELVREDVNTDYMYRAGKEDAYKSVLNIIKGKTLA